MSRFEKREFNKPGLYWDVDDEKSGGGAGGGRYSYQFTRKVGR